MLRIQPQSIITDSTDHYRLRCEGKNGHLEYTFSITWTGEVGVLNCDQREFYFDTHDDPATKLLLNAIDMFDEARRSGSIKPLCLMADHPRPGEQDNRYKVRFLTDTGEAEGTATIQDVDMEDQSIPLLVGDSKFLEFSDGDPAADHLRSSIFALHKARHFNYVEETKAKDIIRPSQSDTDASKRASA